jgi:hypothetical protein
MSPDALQRLREALREWDWWPFSLSDGSEATTERVAAVIEAARAVLSEPLEGGWQPIETAPRCVGSVILACDNWIGEGYFNLSPPRDSSTTGWFKASEDPYDDRPVSPTHWMPLPAAPSVEETA